MNAELSTPPLWAQELLGLTLAARDQKTIAGDLLEEYRGTMVPARGVRGADAWYIRQVAVFLWMAAAPFAILLAASVFIRFVMDAWLPTTTFAQRSLMTSISGAGIYVAMGAYTGWRTRQVRSGMLVALTATMAAVAMNAASSMIFVGIWHDPQTLAAVRNSGGFEEHFTLLLFPVLPVGLLLSAAGAVCGKGLRRGDLPLQGRA